MTEKKAPPQRSEDEVRFGNLLPVLPIRNAVLFPGAVAPFDVGREKSVALVEDDEIDRVVSQIALCNLPRGLCGQRVPVVVLRFPGEAFAADVPLHLLGKLAEEAFFAGVRATLYELDHRYFMAVAEGAGDNAESRRTLALAVAGVDQQDAALFLSGGDLLVDDRFLALHAGIVAGFLVSVVGSCGHVFFFQAGMNQRWPSLSTSFSGCP